MTNKQRILQMVKRWPEDISFDEALYHLHVLQKIDTGLKDIEAGRVIEHDDLFNELLNDEEEKSKAPLVGRSQKRPKKSPRKDREKRGPKNGQGVPQSAKKLRKSAS